MKKAYVILVVALCCLPMLLFPIAGEKTSAEKRELAAFPSLFEEGRFNASFSQEMDAWITDHFSFRSELITANNLLKATLFCPAAICLPWYTSNSLMDSRIWPQAD